MELREKATYRYLITLRLELYRFYTVRYQLTAGLDSLSAETNIE